MKKVSILWNFIKSKFNRKYLFWTSKSKNQIFLNKLTFLMMKVTFSEKMLNHEAKIEFTHGKKPDIVVENIS